METNSTQRLTTTEYAVLGLLGFGESSGYDLARAASRSIGYMWAPSRSQIYKVLPRLVGWGLAESREVEQRGRPDKAVYRITDEGRRTLAAWIEHIEHEPSGGAGVFLLKLFFGEGASPAAAHAQLDAYRGQVERRLSEFQEIEQGLAADESPHTRAALRHGIVRARATLEWADETRRALEDAQGAGTARGARPRNA